MSKGEKMVGCEALRNGNDHFGIHEENNFCARRGCIPLDLANDDFDLHLGAAGDKGRKKCKHMSKE